MSDAVVDADFVQEPATEEQKSYMDVVKDWAYKYVEAGLSVFPLRLDDKKPALEWSEFQDRQPTPEELEDWFTWGVPDGKGGRTHLFGLAIVTGKISGLVVLDCDNQDALSYAVGEAGLFSLVGVQTTRGQHLYFKHPGESKVGNKVGGDGRDWPDVRGLDLRGDGGYVAAPPNLKFAEDGTVKHQYRWTFPDEFFYDYIDSLPVWAGIKNREKSLSPVNEDGEFSFSKLSLASVRTYGANVWDSAGEFTKKLSRKLKDGDGRNTWMTRYIGECVASGMLEADCALASTRFSEEYFEDALPPDEVLTIIRSVVETDKRNHPEKYEAAAEYDNKNEKRQGRAKALRLITPDTLHLLKERAAGRRMLIDPFVPAQSIVQVVGFNGHGKSLWLLFTTWAASLGLSYGSATVKEKVRTLYCDFESGADTLNQRSEDCMALFGSMSPDLAIAASSTDDDATVNLGEPDGMERFQQMFNEFKPQLVVIDTVRSAWEGMEENSPHSWIKVNQLAVACRNTGTSVVIVHHRNKPGQNGIGREAGSTAQLKDLDLQVFVTKVLEDTDQAKREACIPDAATEVFDAKGNKYTSWQYLRLTLPKDHQLNIVFELTFGKRRQATENQSVTYIGMAQSRITGKWHVTHSPSPRQKAEKLSATRTAGEIAALLQVPIPTVERWIKEK